MRIHLVPRYPQQCDISKEQRDRIGSEVKYRGGATASVNRRSLLLKEALAVDLSTPYGAQQKPSKAKRS